MKNKILYIIGLVLMVVGAVLSYFAKVPLETAGGIVASAVGLGLVIAAAYIKAEKKDWKLLVTIICLGVGGFLVGLGGMAKEAAVSLVSAIVGVVIMIIGLIPTLVAQKK
ncbi:MAG: hypothetical protein KBT02_00295 [Treponema sp.]|nr:hypothetical protein [Candidatus Treponema caballi]